MHRAYTQIAYVTSNKDIKSRYQIFTGHVKNWSKRWIKIDILLISCSYALLLIIVCRVYAWWKYCELQ